MNVWEIIEAIDDPSGLIHPERHQAFARQSHPLAKHPAYPQQAPGQGRETNYEEILASRQWQKLLQKANQYLGIPLTKQALPLILKKTVEAMTIIDQAESQYKEELEALAVELIFELPEYRSAKKAYEADRLRIDAQLVNEIDTTGMMASESLREDRTPAEEEWMQKMVQRRHFTNAMIQGSAVSNNFLFELAGQTLDRIHPKLRQSYGILMISTEIGYWMFPQSKVMAGIKAKKNVGSVRVAYEALEEDQPPTGKKPVVIARGMCFPVLIQEIIKGITELASLPSLPRDAGERQEVLNKTDLVDLESWSMMLGPKLWDSFIEAVDAGNERELTMHLYRHIQAMDVDKFNAFMKEILAKSPKGMQMLRNLAATIKTELAGQEGMNEAEKVVNALLDD